MATRLKRKISSFFKKRTLQRLDTSFLKCYFEVSDIKDLVTNCTTNQEVLDWFYKAKDEQFWKISSTGLIWKLFVKFIRKYHHIASSGFLDLIESAENASDQRDLIVHALFDGFKTPEQCVIFARQRLAETFAICFFLSEDFLQTWTD